MQGGTLGSLCFLAFLLSCGVSGSGQNLQDQALGGQEQFDNSEAEYGLSPLAKVDDDYVDERSAQSVARARANARLNAGGLYGPLYGQGHGNSLAQAIAESNVNSFAPGVYGPFSGYGSSLAQSQAQAQAQSSGLGQAQAQAQSLANAQLNHGGGLSDYYGPSSGWGDAQANALANAYGGAGSSQAEAQALAQALSQGGGGLLAPYPGYVDSSLAAANVLANSLGGGGQGYSTAEALAQALSNVQSQPLFNDYSSGGVSSAQANALAQALGGGAMGVPGYGMGGAQSQAQAHSLVSGQAGSVADALANAQAGAGAYGSSYADAFADARTRVIPYHEYVLPYDIPGGQDVVRCTREGELHNLWTSRFECLVCACVNRNGYLTPLCASCAGCLAPPTPPPPLPPQPVPLPVLPLPVPPPRPEPQVSCYPLPTETPFENPLNPCQICVCHLTLDGYGQRDVQIACQENPECSVTDIVVPIPSRYLPPEPLPMAQCELFPTNVFFPHPNDVCSQCKCIVDLVTREPQIVCYPIQDCDVPVPPQPPLYPPVPLPPRPPSPPRPPGPLPGPSPHKSCRPYIPNLPFGHPWDECQECVCSELYSQGVVNIEVSCYTKRSCCIEVPEQLPYVLPIPEPQENVVYIEPRCRYKPPLQPFIADCSVCTCLTVFNYVIAKCDRQPGCGVSPVYPGGLYGGASALANAQVNQFLPQNYYPTSPVIGNTQSSASAEAYANGNGLPYGYNPVDLPYQLGYGSVPGPLLVDGELGPRPGYLQGSSAALAEATAHANAGYDQLGSALAQANALTNAGLQPLRPYPSLSPGYQSGAEADAYSSANSWYNRLLNGLEYGPGSSGSASANSEALSGVNYGLSQYLPLSHLYQPSVGSAEAEALANTYSGYGSGSSVANALANANSGYGSASSIADALANVNSGSGGYGSSSALANALANANSGYGSSSAMADALANVNSGSGNYGSSSALANALANANSGYGSSSALADALAGVNSGYNQLYPVSGSGLSALAEAEAAANANLGYNAYLPAYQPNSLSSAEAEAIANANSGLYSGAPSKAYGSANALSDAYSNVNSYPFSGYSPYGPSYPYAGGYSGADAEAEALANSNLYSGYGPQVNPLYLSGSGGSSSAQAQAIANANALGQANAQSLSQASALAGRPLIKSGRGECKYFGDKYHHSCQACYCLPDDDGSLVALCLGTPCA